MDTLGGMSVSSAWLQTLVNSKIERLASAGTGQFGLPSPPFQRTSTPQGQQTERKRREWLNPQERLRSKVSNRFSISGFHNYQLTLRVDR